MKQTAVEWLLNQIENDSDTHFHNINWDKFDELINQAKEMEKEQMIEFAEKCLDKALDLDVRTAYIQVEQYYNETYER